MSHEPTQADAANAELYTNRLADDPVLLSRMRFVIYALGIATAFVMITGYRYLGEMP